MFPNLRFRFHILVYNYHRIDIFFMFSHYRNQKRLWKSLILNYLLIWFIKAIVCSNYIYFIKLSLNFQYSIKKTNFIRLIRYIIYEIKMCFLFKVLIFIISNYIAILKKVIIVNKYYIINRFFVEIVLEKCVLILWIFWLKLTIIDYLLLDASKLSSQ